MSKKTKKVEIPRMVVTSKAKEFLASQGFRCSADALDKLNDSIAEQLTAAGERCSANNRQTIKPQDL